MRYAVPSLPAILAAAVVCLFGSPEYAQSQTPYFQGKTITIVRGGEPGGTGDMQARALLPSLKKYIPGNPHIIIENMPGAAGMKAVMGTGEFFGEMSLLDGAPRSASVVAEDEVLLMVIPRSAFLKLLQSEPKITIAILATLSQRIRVLQAAGSL